MLLATTLWGWETDKWQAVGAVGSVIAAGAGLYVAWHAMMISKEQASHADKQTKLIEEQGRFIEEQDKMTREHNRLSVKPILVPIYLENKSEAHFVKIKNIGLGVAIIDSVIVFKGGSPTNILNDSTEEWFCRWINVTSAVFECSAVFPKPKDFILSEGECEILKYRPRGEFKDVFKLQKDLKSVELLVKYKSLYDESFDVRFPFIKKEHE